jgi:O-antigen ligase
VQYLIDKRIASLGIFSAVSGTLLVSPWMNWDPINLIKVVAICSAAFSMLFIFMSSQTLSKQKNLTVEDLPFALFILCLFLPLIFADSPLTQQFWGVMGRNTGFLSYLSLCIIAWCISRVDIPNLDKRVVSWLLITGAISFSYGLFQYLGKDPVSWSSKFVFGTLGNVNFFAAFLALVTTAAFSLAFGDYSISKGYKWLLIVFVISLIALNLKTDSMQGPVTTFVGISVAGIIFLYRKFRSHWRKVTVLLILILPSVASLGALGLFNKGPLSRFLYQDSNVFRADYMLSGVRMTLSNPWFGVGLDSYDNAYRKYRGFVTTYRTSPNRTSNSAHNIAIDISSCGGIFLFLSYLSIMTFALVKAIRRLREIHSISGWYVAIFATWIAYLFQSLLSINQIGVGIWGWLLTGVVISSSRIREGTNGEVIRISQSKKGRTRTNKQLPPVVSLFSFLGLSLGFFLAYIPMSADANFRKAMNSSNLEMMASAIDRPGSNAFIISKTLSASITQGNTEIAKKIANKLVSEFPMEIYGWDVIARSPAFDETLRSEARSNIRKIDPNFFCYDHDPSSSFLMKYRELDISARGELLSWWGLVPRSSATTIQVEEAENSEEFLNRVRSLCS